MTTKPSLWGVLTCGPLTAQDRRNQWIATGWLLLWQAVFVASSFLLSDRQPSGPALWVLVAVPTLVGLWAFIVYRRFVLGADELHRKIQLDSMAIGFAAALLGGETLQLISDGVGKGFEAVATMVVATFAYAIANVVLTRYYA